MEPRLSVVVPTLGRPGVLARTLAHLAGQEGAPPHEVIVVVDAAERDAEAVERVAGGARIVRADVAGVSAARNAGWRAATSGLIVFLGDDILAAPGLLAVHAALHDEHPDDRVAGQGHVRWADELRRTPFMEFVDRGRWQFDLPEWSADGAAVAWAHLYSCHLSIKRALLERAGGFDETFTWGYEELELARRLSDEGLDLRWLPRARAEHLHEPTLPAWRDRMRKVARAERQMTERHPDVEPFFAQRAEAIVAAGGRSRTARFERALAEAFLGAWRAPAVDPAVYDESYYRQHCGGAEAWERSDGAAIDPLYAGSLARADLRPGDVVVDVGTGRGELLVAALDAGAARAIGIEYSEDAVGLARRTLAAHATGDRAEVLAADARALPLGDATADLVTLLDVVEHLTEAELDAALAEVLRILRPGGRVLIHTLPSSTLYDVTYRLQRSLTPRRRRTWPADPRNEYEHRMHVGEQSVRSLRRALGRAGLTAVRVEPGAWIHVAFVPDERARRLYTRLARFRLTRWLGAADLWATARRPEGRSTP